MKKLAIILVTLSLLGCGSSPKLVSAKPDFPPPLVDEKTKDMPVCDNLKMIPADVNNLSSVFKIIAENYTLYWQCSNKVDGWKDWYRSQKRIYEGK